MSKFEPAGTESMIAALELAGMSRAEIAARAGISKNTVWRLATGEARAPAYETVNKIEALYAKRLSGSPPRGR